MIKMAFVPWDQVNEDDVRWIAKGCVTDCFMGAPEDLIAKAMDGEVGIYRVSGDAQGIIVTSVWGNKLHIDLLSGRHFIRNYAAIYEEVKRVAASVGLKRLSWLSPGRTREKLYQKLTHGRRVAALFEEELV